MKHLNLFGLAAFLSCLFISCEKSAEADHQAPVTILHKWNLVNDSTYYGLGLNNHPVNYLGKPGDYFDFRADGYLYIREGSGLDTLSYSISSDTTLVIAGFGMILNGVPEV